MPMMMMEWRKFNEDVQIILRTLLACIVVTSTLTNPYTQKVVIVESMSEGVYKALTYLLASLLAAVWRKIQLLWLEISTT